MHLRTILTLGAVLWQTVAVLGGPSLSLQSTLPKEITTGQLVKVDLLLRNDASQEVSIRNFSLAEALPSFFVEVQTTDGKHVYNGPPNFFTRRWAVAKFPIPLVLKPGQGKSFSIVLKCRVVGDSMTGGIFPDQGNYKIRFGMLPIITDAQESYPMSVSDWTPVSVAEAKGAEAEAWRAFQALANTCWLMDPDEMSWQLLRQRTEESRKAQAKWAESLEGFVKEHPNSYWSPLACLCLGKIYLEWGTHPLGVQQGVVNRGALQKAVDHLEAAATAKNFLYEGAARQHLEEAKMLLKNNPPPSIPPP
jgi:hypothetical protein